MSDDGDAVSPFERYAAADVIDLIAAYPLAWVSTGLGCPASLLPLLAETDAEGRLVALVGHMARRNPLADALAADPAATVLFTGPQGYVSPELVSLAGWAPTWNYASLRLDVHVALEPEGGHTALAMLVDAMERERERPWRIAEMGPRYEPMQRAILAFRARVTHLSARFKLGQDERVETVREILARHPDAALVQWMRRLNRRRLEGSE